MPDASVKAMFEWTADYEVGVRQIDGEHRRLFALAETLYQAMTAGKGKAVLQDHLAALLDYTCYHFKHEEQLMERIAYPGYRQHRQDHENLRSTVRAMADRSASGETTMTIEVMLFLMEWLKRHIAGSDRLIGDRMKTEPT
jgi:hemerythrin